MLAPWKIFACRDEAVLTRIFHESLAATLRRTVQVRLGTNPLRLPGGTPIFVVSRQQFMKYPGKR
jgi:hypothetical protein